jgi:predicted ribosomally synthesized peptide with SipW-like signal peptide
MTDNYELSRRKLLAGLGTIGVAGAGAGLGTSALFSDEEEFQNNIVEAGTLDMKVTGEIVAANDEYVQDVTDITGNAIPADGAVETGFEVRDFKPGDWFIVCLTVDSVAENPFYLTIHGEDLEEREGQSTEPESNVDDSTGDDGWESVTETNAELGDKLLTSVWGSYDESGQKSGLTGLSNDTNLGTDASLPSQSYLEPNEDGTTSSANVTYTDIREWFYGEDQDPANQGSGGTVPGSNINNGIASGDGILVGGGEDPVEVGGDPDSSDLLTDPDGDGEGEFVVYVLFELPLEVGNEIQGDRVHGDLRFNAEQVRNNGDPRSGRSTSTSS